MVLAVLLGVAALLMLGAGQLSILVICMAVAIQPLRLAASAMIGHGKRLLRASPWALARDVDSGRGWGPRLMWVTGLALLAAGIIVVVLGLDSLEPRPIFFSGDEYQGVAAAAAGLGAMFFGAFLQKRSRQLLQPSAGQVIEADKRPPVLFLRSFGDEAARIEIKTVQTGDSGSQTEYARLEDALAEQLYAFGPLIAIGKPGERLPSLGAARSYYADDQWQGVVMRWLTDAVLIVVVAGLTKGLEWEIRSIASGGQLAKLIVLFPPSRRDERWRMIKDDLGPVVQGLGGATTAPEGLLAICFPDGRSATIIRSDKPRMEEYERALLHAVYTLKCEGAVPGDRPAPIQGPHKDCSPTICDDIFEGS
jgi:hypothetical protein